MKGEDVYFTDSTLEKLPNLWIKSSVDMNFLAR